MNKQACPLHAPNVQMSLSLQLQNIAEFIQTAVMLVDNPENQLQRPNPYTMCQHMIPQHQCRRLVESSGLCPSSEEIKYCMVRLSLDCVNVLVVEAGSAMNFCVSECLFYFLLLDSLFYFLLLDSSCMYTQKNLHVLSFSEAS
jgi:hypothetical protein